MTDHHEAISKAMNRLRGEADKAMKVAKAGEDLADLQQALKRMEGIVRKAQLTILLPMIEAGDIEAAKKLLK